MIGALDMTHESSSALSNDVLALRAQVAVLRGALELIEHKADQRLQGQYTEKQILGVILSEARAVLVKEK